MSISENCAWKGKAAVWEGINIFKEEFKYTLVRFGKKNWEI